MTESQDYSSERSSPIADLVGHVAASPFLVAPEQADDLKSLIKANGIEIVFDDANPETGLKVVYLSESEEMNEIWFGIKMMERLWAYSYGYVALADRARGLHPGQILEFDDSDPLLQNAMGLVHWALQGDVGGEAAHWPDGLPRPTTDVDFEGFAGTEAFLCMCGFALLHEIGHVVNGHASRNPRTGDDFEEIEYEADDWAASWMLENWQDYDSNPAVFSKRAIGITFVLSVIASFENYDRQFGGLEHPDPIERIIHFLDRYSPENEESAEVPENDAWAVAAIVLDLHLQYTGRRITDKIYGSFREQILSIFEELRTTD